MFVASRDLRAARGRFALISVVVVLIALLVTFLSGLTSGLRHQNVSAVELLGAESVVFADTDDGPSFDESVLTAEQVAVWQGSGAAVDPIGIARGAASVPGGSSKTVAFVGADGGVGDRAPGTPGSVILGEGAARSLGVAAGDEVTIGGDCFTVSAVRGDDWYSHSPVVWMTLADWQHANPRGGAATVLAVSGGADATDTVAGTTSRPVADSLSAIGSYTSENGSLTLMTVMLFAISALVIGAFFTVWTLQRTPDVATLKALGASTGSLVRDALGQALVVLLAGAGAGVGVAAVAGSMIGDAVPFVLDASTTVLPATALVGLGLLGAAFALRFLVTTDPLTALGSTR
ncbi:MULTISPECIES: ABC transporter permease [unclassified Rhodococcus (in: high G+C Gram-positive bacteria)]|uniref:ABC transporter permease n=1 Tax=unclassified Rhodococcus (in: high G+C Gram-positive bacteria) TaxID=192944 RepID=UPI00163954DB|nr:MULTISPECIES: ABC transporter permease [unclassified Rhodococcus (in: high G+C Gram-positive bacteria)]MBC2641326.1 ABC transporter permease [Rhodococcus sp. 3A]MBC2893929.1 ABC transporter permease [Rhodococcus sp. 4CII]